jgi:hypothetical protein
MLGLIVHWDLPAALLAARAAQQKLLGWITLTCKTFGVDKLVLVDVEGTGIEVRDEEINAHVVPTLEDALRQFDTLVERVYIEHGGQKLCTSSFCHPNDAVYIVGSDYGALVVPPHAQHVTIESVRNEPL